MMASSGQPQGSASEDNYVLGRDFNSSSRLNYEHYLWHETLGYNLHPAISEAVGARSSIPSTNSQPLRIVDVACGTAFWTLQVAQELPHARLEASDINLSQCPSTGWLPSNITFREWDLFSDVPSEMVGRFDVVHVRLIFVLVRKREDVERVVGQLARLLKPGGWLQWDELDVASTYLSRADSPLATEVRKEASATPVLDATVGFLKGIGKWVSEVNAVMRALGLENVKMWECAEKRELAKALFDNHLAKEAEEARVSGHRNRNGEGSMTLQKLDAMYEESKNGVVTYSPIVVFTASKPAARLGAE